MRRLVLFIALLAPAPVGAQHFPADEDLELMARYLVEDGESPGVVLGVREADGSTRILMDAPRTADAPSRAGQRYRRSLLRRCPHITLRSPPVNAPRPP